VIDRAHGLAASAPPGSRAWRSAAFLCSRHDRMLTPVEHFRHRPSPQRSLSATVDARLARNLLTPHEILDSALACLRVVTRLALKPTQRGRHGTAHAHRPVTGRSLRAVVGGLDDGYRHMPRSLPWATIRLVSPADQQTGPTRPRMMRLMRPLALARTGNI
jgi:hypothetical protein